MIRLAIVCPCYNEEDVLDLSAGRLSALLEGLIQDGKLSADSFILLVNDGSKDATWQVIKRLHEANTFVKGLNLAHNVGHQFAIMAGMMQARTMADAVVTIDADLQDDLGCIPQMVDAHLCEGADVVYGVKVQRNADPLLKRLSAEMFYKLQHQMGADIVYNHADFRFLSRRVLDALSLYEERNLYLRGLIPQIGFKSTTVQDHISERQAGVSKYTLGKMLSLAMDGITSCSIQPLYWIIYTGLVFVLISICIAVYVICSLLTGSAVPGWSSLMLSIWLVGGVTLVSLGVCGVYVGKIYREVKRRPLYHVADFLD